MVKSGAFMDMDEGMHYPLPLTLSFPWREVLFVGSSLSEPPVRFLEDVGDASHPDVDGDLLPEQHLGQRYLSVFDDQRARLTVENALDRALQLLVWQ